MCSCLSFRELSDIDKDGKLSCDEFAIAMHLIAKVKGGASLPNTLPADLYGPAKYYTVDRATAKAAKAGMPPLEKKVCIIIQVCTFEGQKNISR